MSDYPAGARLMLGFHGLTPSSELAELLHETQARSIILFARNIVDAAQCRELIAGVRALVPWPLLVAVDQEGGAVVRLTSGATVFPGNMTLGAADDEDLARRVGQASGAELAGIGFDLNLGPVIDLQTNPANPGIGIRSFGAQRERALALARAWIQGHAEHGVAACIKHFPGKGAAAVDAHLDLPILELSLEDFRDPHLRIFEDLFDCEESLTVMTTHIIVRGLDPDLPATLSPRVVKALLREELGFDGLVISDDLEMGAIEKHHGVVQAALQAAIAGHDVLPICHSLGLQRRAAKLLAEALADGRLDLGEHERACRRIEALAARSVPAAERGLVDPSAGEALSREVCERAVHVFASSPGFPAGLASTGQAGTLLPIPAGSTLLVLAAQPHAVVGVEEAADRDWAGLVGRCLADAGIAASELRSFELAQIEAERDTEFARLFAAASPGAVDEACSEASSEACAGFDRVLLLGWNARGSDAMRSLLEEACSRLSDRLIVAHLRNPFDQIYVAEGVTALTVFGYRVRHIEALARCLAGRIPARGILPAPISLAE